MKPYYDEGGITIYHGDCLHLFGRHDDPPIREWPRDVLVTDPPYGISYRSGKGRIELAVSIQGDEDTSLRDDVLDWWGELPALVFGSWKRPRPPQTHTRLIWDTKGALGMGDLAVPWKPSDQEIYVLGYGFAGRRDSNVLRVAPVQSMARNGRLHPHEKPVPLMRMLLKKCPTGVVLDPFMGSGSTLRAAKDLGKEAIGIEIEERYCEIAAQRLAQEVLDLGGGSGPPPGSDAPAPVESSLSPRKGSSRSEPASRPAGMDGGARVGEGEKIADRFSVPTGRRGKR